MPLILTICFAVGGIAVLALGVAGF